MSRMTKGFNLNLSRSRICMNQERLKVSFLELVSQGDINESVRLVTSAFLNFDSIRM